MLKLYWRIFLRGILYPLYASLTFILLPLITLWWGIHINWTVISPGIWCGLLGMGSILWIFFVCYHQEQAHRYHNALVRDTPFWVAPYNFLALWGGIYILVCLLCDYLTTIKEEEHQKLTVEETEGKDTRLRASEKPDDDTLVRPTGGIDGNS